MSPAFHPVGSDSPLVPVDAAVEGPAALAVGAGVGPAFGPVRRPWPALTWLLDGAGWSGLRATVDLTLLGAGTTAAAVASHTGLRLALLVPLSMVFFWLRGLYRQRLSARVAHTVAAIATALCCAVTVLALWDSYVVQRPLGEATLLSTGVHVFALLLAGRLALLALRLLAREGGLTGKPTIVVGAGRVGAQIVARLNDRRGYGLAPVGFIDYAEAEATGAEELPLPVLGAPGELEAVVRETDARHVVIAFSRERDHDLVPLIRRCSALGLEVSLIPRLFESVNHRTVRDSVGPLPLHIMQPTNPRNWEFAVKHVLDRTLAGLGLLTLAPLLAAIAAGVKLSSPGAVLFRQRRVGRDGRCFEMLKFRSMRAAADPSWEGPPGGLAPGGVEGGDRRTGLGRWLRRTSLDELPQLWNVLRGDMSLVGPRPERPEFVERFRGEVSRYDDRHRVKSGITGAAQVNGLRGRTGLADRIEWDNYYIENWSLALDLKILLHTVLAVLRPVE